MRLWPGGDEKAGGAGEAHAADIGETGLAEPGGVFGLAVAGAATRADEHVEGEKRSEARSGLVGLQNKILNHKTAAGSERFVGAVEKSTVFLGRKHVADGRDEHEVEVFAVAGGEHVAGASGNAIGQPGVAYVSLGDGDDFAKIEDLGV